MIGLTSLISRNPPMEPKLNRKRAQFVLSKIDQILDWERRINGDRDTRFVDSDDTYAKFGRDNTGGWRT